MEAYSPSLDGRQEPCIPSNTLVDETFTISRSAAFSNVIVFRKVSGDGPERITFGIPNGGTYTSQIGSGAVYTRESVSVNGDNTAGIVRLTGNTLELEDANDGDFNDLTITPTRGRFTDKFTYVG